MRCKKKGIGCEYSEPAVAGRRPLLRSAAAAHTVRVEPCRTPSTSHVSGASHADEATLAYEDFCFAEDPVFNETPLQLFSGNERQPVDLTTQSSPLKEFLTFDELFVFEDDTLGQHQCSTDVSLALPDNSDQQSASWCVWMRGNFSLAVVTENPLITFNSNVLAVHQLRRPHAQHNAALIIQSLRSFPTMMLRRETFPWFIHPHSQVQSKSAGADLPEALSTCMSIAQMFVSRTSETKHFLRQTIGTEYRRFVSQVRFPDTPRSISADCQTDVPNVPI